jgi:pyrroline-5-carboxylate reductase
MKRRVIGILGLGTMGGAIADGLLGSAQPYHLLATRRTTRPVGELPGPIEYVATNGELAERSDIVVLSVKPYQAEAVVGEIAPRLKGKMLVSILAAVESVDLEAWAPGCRVIRVMPNTPCLIGAGMTVVARGLTPDPEGIALAEELFAPLGRTAVVDEALMDAVTGLSGCGPAYVFLIIEALSEAGVKLGIDRATSTLLVAQTLLGAARMVLERGEHPAKLKDEVTTPAGCTVDALMVLEDGRLRSTLIAAVVAAAERSKSLRKR